MFGLRNIQICLATPLVAIAFFLGLAMSGQVWACTADGWSSTVGNSYLSTGDNSDGFPVYDGQCSLKVALQASEAYVLDDAPVNEAQFNARFYFLLDEVASDALIYQAMDGAQSVLQAHYSASDGMIDVVFSGSPERAISLGPVSAGWNSLELRWRSGAAAQPSATLQHVSDSQTKVSPQLDTSNLFVDAAQLGVSQSEAAAVPTSGNIYFDAYESRRDALKDSPFQATTEAEQTKGSQSTDEGLPTNDGTPVAIPIDHVWSHAIMVLLLWLTIALGGARIVWQRSAWV